MALQDCDAPATPTPTYTATDLFDRLSFLRLNLWRYNIVTVAGGAVAVDPLTSFGEQKRGWTMPGGSATPRVQVLGKVQGLATRDGAAYALSFEAAVDAGTATIRARFLDASDGAITGISDQSWSITTTPTTFTWEGIASDDPDFAAAIPNNSYFEFFVSDTSDIPSGKTVTITNLQIQTDNYWDQQGISLPWRPAKGEPDLIIYGDYILGLNTDEMAVKPGAQVIVGPEGGGLVLVPSGPVKLQTEGGTTRTLNAGDDGSEITFTHADGCTVTLPQNADATITTKSQTVLRRATGAGPVVVVAGTGATLVGPPGCTFTITSEEGQATVEKKTTDGWEWSELVGNPTNIGGVTIESASGVPTRNDRAIASLATRTDVSQLWRAIPGLPAKAAICFAVDRSVFSPAVYAVASDAVSSVLAVLADAIDAGADYDLSAISWGSDSGTTSDLTKRAATSADCASLDSFIAGQTLNSENTNPEDAITSAKAFFDATDAGFTQRYLFVLTDGDINGHTPSVVGAAITTLMAGMTDVKSYAMQVFTSPWSTHITPDELTWMATYDNTPDDAIPTFTDDAAGCAAAILAGLSTVRWRKMSDLTSIRLNGTEIEAEPVSLDVIDANGVLVAATDGAGAVTFTLNTDTDGTMAADSDDRIATQKAVATKIAAAVAAAVNGLSWKQAVRAATTTAGTLASSFENGDAIDGVTLATGDRILVKNQASGSENGIYVVNASGAPTRAVDADVGSELVVASVYVSEGTANADTQWTCTTNAPITIGSTATIWTQISSGAASGSITASGYTQSSAKVLGRTTASTGGIEEITIGPGLVMSGGVLSGTGAGGLFVIKPPTTALFSLSNLASGATLAVNQGSTYYSISRSDTGAAGERVCFQGKAVPAGTSWTATIGFWSTPYGRTNKCRAGLSLIESGTLKSLNLFHNTEAGSPEIDIFAYTNLTTFSSAPYNSAKIFGGRQALFMQVTYNGTSYIFALSDNFGETFTTIATLAKATYFTTAADRIGVALDTGTVIVANECRMEIFYYSDPDF